MIVGLLGAAIIFVPTGINVKNKFMTFMVMTTIYSALSYLAIYSALPRFTFPLAGLFSLLVFGFWLVSRFVCFILKKPEAKVFTLSHVRVPNKNNDYKVHLLVGYFVLFLFFFVKEIFCSFIEEKKLMVNIESETKQYWSCNSTKFKIIPEKLAISYAEKKLETSEILVGDGFSVNDDLITLQKIGSAYYYLIPLDYQNKKSWNKNSSVPGYFKILATDPYVEPQLILGLTMNYTPGSYYFNNYRRHLYWKYFDKLWLRTSFQENEAGKVFFISEVCRGSFWKYDNVFEGIIILDPETGLDEYVPEEKLKTPAYSWIDRELHSEIIYERFITSQ